MKRMWQRLVLAGVLGIIGVALSRPEPAQAACDAPYREWHQVLST
jgi:hypothetical protein